MSEQPPEVPEEVEQELLDGLREVEETLLHRRLQAKNLDVMTQLTRRHR